MKIQGQKRKNKLMKKGEKLEPNEIAMEQEPKKVSWENKRE